jgi:hypothetical protein
VNVTSGASVGAISCHGRQISSVASASRPAAIKVNASRRRHVAATAVVADTLVHRLLCDTLRARCAVVVDLSAPRRADNSGDDLR